VFSGSIISIIIFVHQVSFWGCIISVQQLSVLEDQPIAKQQMVPTFFLSTNESKRFKGKTYCSVLESANQPLSRVSTAASVRELPAQMGLINLPLERYLMPSPKRSVSRSPQLLIVV